MEKGEKQSRFIDFFVSYGDFFITHEDIFLSHGDIFITSITIYVQKVQKVHLVFVNPIEN